MLVYPFTSPLNIMKPCKIDPKKKSHVSKLAACMHSSEYIWEEKLDGISLMSIGGRQFSNVISTVTGWPGEKTMHVPQISEPLTKQGSRMILDGEAYRMGWKSNQVNSIMGTKNPAEAISKQTQKGFLQYWVYDMIRDPDGTWLTGVPFLKRRALLEELFKSELRGYESLILNDMHECVEEDPAEAFQSIIDRGLEGIVLKSKSGLYVPGSRPMWNQIKLKAELTDDVVIMGFLPATKKYTGINLDSWPYWEGDVPLTKHYAMGLIGSIQIGKYDAAGNLVVVGSVTGLKEELRLNMTTSPDSYIGQVIKIKAMEKTEDGSYRHANFADFHPDKNAYECTLYDQIG